MRAPALPSDDGLLSKREVGERLHAKGRHLNAIVAKSTALRAGRVYRGRRAYFAKSSVVLHIHREMAAAPQVSP